MEEKIKSIMRESHERVEAIMQEKEVSVSDLAKKTRIKPNTMRGYIQSRSNFTLSSLIKIAEALDVSMAYLLGEIKTEKPNDEACILKYLKKLINTH